MQVAALPIPVRRAANHAPPLSPQAANRLKLLEQRTKPPWLGKDKIAAVLRKAGWQVSASSVGRILADAKRRGIPCGPSSTPSSARGKSPNPRAVSYVWAEYNPLTPPRGLLYSCPLGGPMGRLF